MKIDRIAGSSGDKCECRGKRPSPSKKAHKSRDARTKKRKSSSQEYVIPEGITRSRTSRFNVARPPTTETRPSRGPWLAIGLCCPDGSSLTTASCAPLNPSPLLMDSRRGLLHPRKIGLRWESRGSPIYSAGLDSRAASLTPVAPKSADDCCFLFGFSLHLPVTVSAITLVVSRLQSSLRVYFALMLRPASWLALLLRTFPFELAPTQVTLNQRRI